MRFLIISSIVHKVNSKNQIGGYGPYIKEMNLWLRHVNEVIIVAPVQKKDFDKIDLPYEHDSIDFRRIPDFNLKTIGSIIKTILVIPFICIKIASAMRKAGHIHLRCPNNTGLLGCFVQIFFPRKTKTAKYAGNWDWNSKQPWSYRLQQRILRSTFFTRNMTALVYGEWPDRTKNIKPFFTASYSEKERLPFNKKQFSESINLAFVGTLTENKSPLTSLDVLKELIEMGINATLIYCGDGPEYKRIEQKARVMKLDSRVKLLGNVNSTTVKEVLQQSHFLVFISRSEGWPKAVAEAMWWACLPITTPVSCVPQMLGNGERGELVSNGPSEIAEKIKENLLNPDAYQLKCDKAQAWSREFTLEKFEAEIKQLLNK